MLPISMVYYMYEELKEGMILNSNESKNMNEKLSDMTPKQEAFCKREKIRKKKDTNIYL